MKVLIGWMEDDHGTVEASPGGLLYTGPESEHVCGIVERKRDWYDRNSIKHVLSDELLVRSLPYRLQGALWAVFVDEATGLTQHQPAYDPWGKRWYSRSTSPAPVPIHAPVSNE